MVDVDKFNLTVVMTEVERNGIKSSAVPLDLILVLKLTISLADAEATKKPCPGAITVSGLIKE